MLIPRTGPVRIYNCIRFQVQLAVGSAADIVQRYGGRGGGEEKGLRKNISRDRSIIAADIADFADDVSGIISAFIIFSGCSDMDGVACVRSFTIQTS